MFNSATNTNYYDFKITSFNCHGLKSSIPYAKELFSNTDIMFLCEHWLHSGELKHVVSEFPDVWSNLKSSIDPSKSLLGRPFGGCGFICKNTPGVTYRSITCTSDKISGVEVIVDQKTVLCVLGAYLPYDTHTKVGLTLYLETLHELQGYIDNNCGSTPYTVIGDFNTRLPMSKTIVQKWYNKKGYGKRSALLYDFIRDNDLYVANFAYSQKWIIHIITTSISLILTMY